MKREEIREELISWYNLSNLDKGRAWATQEIDVLLGRLDKRGVVIRANREFPSVSIFIAGLLETDLSHEERIEELKKFFRDLGLEEAGCGFFEPLIEAKDDDKG